MHALRRVVCAVVLVVAASIVAPPVGAHTATPESGQPSTQQTPSWFGAVPGLGELAPDPEPQDATVKLAGCTISNPMFSDDPDRVRPFVPSRYRLGSNAFFGPGAATIMAAVLACDGARVGSRAPAPTVLSLVAVQVEAEPADGNAADTAWSLYTRSTLSVLTSSSWYLIAAHTDNADLAARFRKSRVPVDYVDRVSYTTDYRTEDKSDSVVIPVRGGEYRLATTTRFPDPFVHNHDWSFWHDGTRGKRAGLFLHLHAMSDSSCSYWTSPVVGLVQPGCKATLAAPPRSRVAKLLGTPTRETPYAFNHPPSDARGHINLTREVRTG